MPPRKAKVPPSLSRKNNPEKVVTMNLLNGFTIAGSRGEAIIEEILQQKIKKASLNGLIQLGSIIGDLIGIKLPRNYKRKKDLIVKWFEEHEELITPYLSYLRVEFDCGNKDSDAEELSNASII
ncbi:hypothetical protein M9Y10_030256 [Tritrichomonas musculus]|uniref:Uncharacterized protein n=1 Tax=Tritrichomonas musculus TaxID=1915356 RepID=A0ABR2KSS4_9EUKA